MTYKITATAPTVYQLNSLIAFGMGFQKNANGSFSASQEFDNNIDASLYLQRRAEMYNDQDPEGSPEKLSDMVHDIDYHSCLTLDAVTAHIEPIDEIGDLDRDFEPAGDE